MCEVNVSFISTMEYPVFLLSFCVRWFVGLSIKQFVCGQQGVGASDGKIIYNKCNLSLIQYIEF